MATKLEPFDRESQRTPVKRATAWAVVVAALLVIFVVGVVKVVVGVREGHRPSTTSRASAGSPTESPNAAPWFALPPPGETWEVEGVVVETGRMPATVRSAYRDHILAVHLANVSVSDPPRSGGQAVVYLRSMAAGKLTEAAALRAGQRVRLRIRDWRDVSRFYETIQRFELRSAALLTQPPCWGVL